MPFRFVLGTSEPSPLCRAYASSLADAYGDVEAQCATDPRGMIAWVRTENGDFIDLIDTETGHAHGRTRLDRHLTRAPLEPPETAIRTQEAWRAHWPGRGDRGWRTFEPNESGIETAISIARDGVPSDSFWTFRDSYGCIAIALVETEDTLFAAQHCRTSSGMWLFALSLDAEPAARERWMMRPSGVGDAGSWTASNEVAIEFVDGHVRVWGREGEGRYVSTLDRETGLELATLIEPRR